MKTGEVVRDPQGRVFHVGQPLGRGLWGRTFAAKEEGGGEWVLKVPLSAAELPEGGEKLARACQEIALEQARLLQQAAGPGLVPCEAVFRDADGVPVLVLPRYPSSLERRLSLGCPFEEVLAVLLEATRILRGAKTGQSFHGLLKPTNLLITDRGEVRLSDFATPALRRNLASLLRASPQGQGYLAPEVRRAATEDPPLSVAADTYALAMMVYRGVLAEGAGGPALPLPEDGLDKAALVSLKDRIHNRLKSEPSNPRFHTRLADRAAALLNRALSKEVSPSPPFRFARHDEFLARLEEVAALVHPAVTHVGKILLDRPPASETFTTDEEATFSCTIACSPGVETHEEIATGLALFDQDKDERVRQVQCSYTVDRHPSGRFRFGFRISELPPATYRVRLAFTIRDSGHEPLTAEGRFVLRAAPGYVPPRVEPEARPIPLERPVETSVTERRALTSPGEPARAPEAPRPEPQRAEPVRPVDLARPVEPPREVPRPPEPPPAVAVAPPSPVARVAPVGPSPGLRLAPPPSPSEDLDEDEPEARPSAVAVAADDADDEDDEDAFTESPQYRGAGRWTDLPVPGFEPRPRAEDGDDEEDEGLESSTNQDPTTTAGWRASLAEPLQRVLELARGEAYWLYLGGAVLVILVLLIALLALR